MDLIIPQLLPTVFNIFSDSTFSGSISSDQLGVDSLTLNLGSLQYNGGITQTILPGAGSPAIDMGNQSDMSDAQNQPVSGGRRDVGAAETTCTTTAGTLNETVCFGDSIIVNGTVYNANNLTGTEVYTNVGVYNCDSTVTVTLTIEDAIDVSTTTNGLTITANTTGAIYNWIDCGTGNSIVPAETGISFTATINGDYAVVVTEGNCSDTSDCVNFSTVNIEDQASNLNLSIHPNPTINKLKIENNDVEINTVSIINITGNVVKAKAENTKIIDVSNLTNGIYFLLIHTDKGLVSKKFIKE